MTVPIVVIVPIVPSSYYDLHKKKTLNKIGPTLVQVVYPIIFSG